MKQRFHYPHMPDLRHDLVTGEALRDYGRIVNEKKQRPSINDATARLLRELIPIQAVPGYRRRSRTQRRTRR